MNARKLLDWRKLLLYSHRWMGIAGGLLFVSWFLSGIVIMYKGMPALSASERLEHMRPVDLSTARLSPAEAASEMGTEPSRLRIEMFYDGRPIYRFQGMTAVYADTGEFLPGATADEAVDFVKRWTPERASTVRYDGYLEDSDQWTLQGAQRAYMPLHRIAVGDAEDTYYYVSEYTGEPVMKTDRESRWWGFWSAVLHWVYFTPLRRNGYAWNQFIIWGSFVGAVMCLTGLVAGIWRFSSSARFRQKHAQSHTPYSGWMRWHHYAGLLFGLFSFTWIVSGALSVNPYGWAPGTGPTRQQREAVTGGPVDFQSIGLDQLRAAAAAFLPEFAPKEIDVFQFRGKLYLTANPPLATDHRMVRMVRMVSLAAPERGTFTKFDDGIMLDIAREAMPGVPVQDETWLHEYDSYYYSRDGVRPLPVLRVRYADAQSTWLYLDPHRGSISRYERLGRLNRWLYHGLHSLDFPFLYYRRPLWDIVVIVLSIGGIALSATTLWPAFRRLMRHGRHWLKVLRPQRMPVVISPNRR
jgi:hypothetical protein